MAQRLGRALLDLLLHPLTFFEQAARSDRLDTPLAVLAFVSAVQVLVIVATGWPGTETTDRLAHLAGVLGAAALAFASPFVRAAVLAAFFHPFELLTRPGRHFRRTYRAVSWGVVFSLLGYIPTAGAEREEVVRCRSSKVRRAAPSDRPRWYHPA